MAREKEGLRERKKRATRTAIASAARDLFAEHGFDRVTVAEIAAAADVSEKTVFNHFATKEDLAFAGDRARLDALVKSLAARPAGTSVLDVFRSATDALIEGLTSPRSDTDEDLRLLPRIVRDNRALQERLTIGSEHDATALAAALGAAAHAPLAGGAGEVAPGGSADGVALAGGAGGVASGGAADGVALAGGAGSVASGGAADGVALARGAGGVASGGAAGDGVPGGGGGDVVFGGSAGGVVPAGDAGGVVAGGGAGGVEFADDDIVPAVVARMLWWTHRAILRAALAGLEDGEDPGVLAARLRVSAARAYDRLAVGLGDYGVRTSAPLVGDEGAG